MSFSLIQLPVPRRSGPPDAVALHSVAVPVTVSAQARLAAAIDRQGLGYDARAVWIGYPNLQRAALALLEQLSADWPCRSRPNSSAAVRAVLHAIRAVRRGMERDERSRDQITANFLQGLASAAADTAGTIAWGFRTSTPIAPFELWSGSFARWCREGELTEVRFYRSGGLSSCETEGTRLKLLCAVANARDVGVASRWRAA